jgi:hypothetical protein
LPLYNDRHILKLEGGRRGAISKAAGVWNNGDRLHQHWLFRPLLLLVEGEAAVCIRLHVGADGCRRLLDEKILVFFIFYSFFIYFFVIFLYFPNLFYS